jgi:Ser/Thr protein kinase RdoA (MazF antagonist)
LLACHHQRERLARERVQVEPSQPPAFELLGQPGGIHVADLELESPQQLARLAEHHHRVIVARHVGELSERPDRGAQAPQRIEVAGDLLLHRGGDAHQVACRDVAGQRNERDIVGQRHRSTPSGGARDTLIMLAQADVAHYLLSLGLVKPAAVVEEELRVTDSSRRNRVFIASARTGPAYVVKQAGPGSAATLAHEAAVLRALASTPELADLVPWPAHQDPEAGLLVLSTPAGARTWSDHHDEGRFPVAPARRLGRALAALHRLAPGAVDALPLEFGPMWALSLPEPPHALMLGLSATAVELVARIQASEFMCRRLDQLGANHSERALLHGDLRWENCLLVAGPGGRRRTRVLLVDWELAGRGPVSFDVGTVLAEYLCRWVGSIPILDPGDVLRFLHAAEYPLALMRPAMRAFWTAYRADSPRPPTPANVVELAAVRLVQAALELAIDASTLSAHMVMLVQIADNLLRDPEGAAFGLLALEP